MKKIIYIIATVFFVCLFFNANLHAQPKVTLNADFGYGFPIGDFKVAVPTDAVIDDELFAYHTKQLINFGADGKLAIGKNGNFRAVVGLTYNMFSNNTNAIFQSDTMGGTVTTSFKPKVNIISVYLGGEWAFLPKGKINPYVGIDAIVNFFGGSFTFGQPVYVKDELRTGPMDMKAETRIGLLLDAGVDYKISKLFGANLGVKYHIINLAGAGADVESEVGPNEIDLGDKAHTADNGISYPNKMLSSFQFYAGFSFYFGAPKTTPKK